MPLELIYWITLGVGLGLLVLSLLLGDVFDVLNLEIGGGDFAAGPVFFAATAAFGAGGLLATNAFGMGPGSSVAAGLGAGAGMGGLTALLFLALRSQEAGPGFEISQLVGLRGRCTLATGPGRTGRVQVRHAGMQRSLPATSTEEIAVGDEVVVTAVVGSVLTVARPDGP